MYSKQQTWLMVLFILGIGTGWYLLVDNTFGSRRAIDQPITKPLEDGISNPLATKPNVASNSNNTYIHIAIVACGLDRVLQARVLARSIDYFLRPSWHLTMHIVTNLQQRPKLSLSPQIAVRWYNLSYPSQNAELWHTLFKPCAAQRLFLPGLLSAVTQVIYLDIDTILVTDIARLWQHFKLFSPTQTAAMAPEGQVLNRNWYHRFARHPYPKPMGLNSGVMLMHLARLRGVRFEQRMQSLLKLYQSNITWGGVYYLSTALEQGYVMPRMRMASRLPNTTRCSSACCNVCFY
eukprot:m.93026 g.93026  ORF g.93026 m.93026 type:complete len:292 (-) comp14971_c2_seq6:988-1863(-)